MTAKTHGLDGKLVQADWPPLSIEEVRSLLNDFDGIEEPVELLSVSPRPFSAASIVGVGKRRLFVKRHARAVRDAQGLSEEHRFMHHLQAHGAAVPRVLTSNDGRTAIQMGNWTYEVHEHASGVDLYGDAQSWTPFRYAEHAYAAGEALARLHCAAKGYDAPARVQRQLVAGFTIWAQQDATASLNAYVESRPGLANYLAGHGCAGEAAELIAPFHAELLFLLPALKPLWTHNDLHASNVFWSANSRDAYATAVIDFGLCDRTNAVHDLAHAIERNVVEWLVLVDEPLRPENVPVHLDHLYALLNGYESVRQLSDAEAASLAPMTALCHAEFALSETDYFVSVLQSEQKARMACEGYLVAHARWFAGAGNRLLPSIRAWAQSRASHSQGAGAQ